MTRFKITVLTAGCGVIAALAGCSGTPQRAPAGIGQSAAAQQACVPISPNGSLQITDSRTLVYRSGATAWVNRLATDCRGVTSMDIPVIYPNGSQYCHGDIVRTVDRDSHIPGPACVLGDFVAYHP